MIHLRMIWRSWRNKPISPVSIILLLALSIALSVSVQHVDQRVERYWKKQSSGVDVVIGAKGSPLQLVLANIFHADAPTGNLNPGDFRAIQTHPRVKKAIPLGYGDTYKGYRILGTSEAWFSLMGSELVEGEFPKKPYECAIGSEVERLNSLSLGSRFTGSHGDVGGHNHEHEYTVVGILKKKGDVSDRLIATPIETVWQEHHVPSDQRAVTAVLVQLKTAMAKLTFPREINGKGEWMAAVPAIEVSKLLSLTGDVSLLTKVLAAVLSGVSVLMLFLLLVERSESKRKELALFRFEGASGIFAFTTLFSEGLLLVLLGTVLAYPVTVWSAIKLEGYHAMLSGLGIPCGDIWLIVLLVGVTSVFFSSLLPWLQTMRMNLSETLRNELD